jgi:hypothetical protein
MMQLGKGLEPDLMGELALKPHLGRQFLILIGRSGNSGLLFATWQAAWQTFLPDFHG